MFVFAPDCSTNISIHALREEGDLIHGHSSFFFSVFLSTPSARRATWNERLEVISSKFLSTPSARRATPQNQPCPVP